MRTLHRFFSKFLWVGGIVSFSVALDSARSEEPRVSDRQTRGGVSGGTGACVPADPAAGDPTGINKVRVISFVPGNAGVDTAIRVTLTSLHHPDPRYPGSQGPDYSALEGQVRWVGPPVVFDESGNLTDIHFVAAQLQCAPYLRDWGVLKSCTSTRQTCMDDSECPAAETCSRVHDALHVYGAEVVPSSLYDVQAISSDCDTDVEKNYSAALTIPTNRFGDIETPYQAPGPPTQPDFVDIGAAVDKFRSVPGAPIIVRAKTDEQVMRLEFGVGFGSIGQVVRAFVGEPYRYFPPDPCP